MDALPKEVRDILEQVRQTVAANAPEATQRIAYNMPAFYYNGPLVYFAAFAKHIGFYALPSGNQAFQQELSRYKTGKGSIQFPINQPIPLDLIARIVRMRVLENASS